MDDDNLFKRAAARNLAENEKLRAMLAYAFCGEQLYDDDGELQDNRVHPFIDFRRDLADEIEDKMRQRLRRVAAALAG